MEETLVALFLVWLPQTNSTSAMSTASSAMDVDVVQPPKAEEPKVDPEVQMAAGM